MSVQPDQKVSGFTMLAENFIPARFFSFLEVVRVVDIPVVSLGESRRRERHRKCQKPWRKETFASMV